MEQKEALSSGISSEVAPLIRQARIAAGMTQKTLAEKSGCKQSAVSMFEAGKKDALAYDSIVKIARLLKVELPKENETIWKTEEGVEEKKRRGAGTFCPGFDCPSNVAYMVGVSVYLLPTGAAGWGKHCVLCGEAVSTLCHVCGAQIGKTVGACCAECGAALIPFPHDTFTGSVEEWTRLHNEKATFVKGVQ